MTEGIPEREQIKHHDGPPRWKDEHRLTRWGIPAAFLTAYLVERIFRLAENPEGWAGWWWLHASLTAVTLVCWWFVFQAWGRMWFHRGQLEVLEALTTKHVQAEVERGLRDLERDE